MRKGKRRPDPDARIGWCPAKKRGFVGYRYAPLITCGLMVILGFIVLPGNVNDISVLSPLLLDVAAGGFLKLFRVLYGDNIFDTADNRALLVQLRKECRFHTKDETGKHPAKPRSARRKSKRRSRIESTFGIATENFAFGHLQVWTFPAVETDLALFSTAWNFFFLMAWLVGRPEDGHSLKQLMYEK